MKTFRLQRLFYSTSKRCLCVALDSSFPGAEIVKAEAIRETISALAESGVDALRLTLEQAEWLQQIPGRQRPALILRADATNMFVASNPLTAPRFCRIVSNVVDHALRLDAAALAIHIFDDPDHPEIVQQCLENLLHVQAQCERWCLPLVIELRPKSRTDWPALCKRISSPVASLGNLLSLPHTGTLPNLPEDFREMHTHIPSQGQMAPDDTVVGYLLEAPVPRLEIAAIKSMADSIKSNVQA